MFKTVKALRREGISKPWTVAFSLLKSRYLPHRTHLWSDGDGFRYDPMILRWNLGKWQIWEDTAERNRQRERAGLPTK